MNPQTFERLSKGKDQNSRVFQALVNAPMGAGDWVSLKTLSRAAKSLNISKRVSDLRLLHGVKIENKCVQIKGQTLKRSFYRITQ